MVFIREQKDFSQVRDLFRGLMVFQPMCTAVLDGVWPGDVYVDHPAQPRAALLVSYLAGGGPAWCFLVGDAQDSAFNRKLNQAIFQDGVLGETTTMCLFTCDPADWGGRLGEVGAPRQPAPMARRHYVATRLAYDWRNRLPENIEVRAMDASLLTSDALVLPEPVQETLKNWASNTQPAWRDFGWVAVRQGQVVAWATVDFVTAGSGDLGFETLPAFQRQGLGSAVAAAAIEHGLAIGLKTIHWTCMQDNLASIATAEKLGLRRERDYAMYVFAMDVNNHRAYQAYALLEIGRLEEACHLYEDLFAEGVGLPLWAYFDAAKARAALGDASLAISHLQRAVELGWTSLESIEQTPEFQALLDTPAMVELAARIRANQAKSQ